MTYNNLPINTEDEKSNRLKEDYAQNKKGHCLIAEPDAPLRTMVMTELKGYFTKLELTALVDSQNGVLLTNDFTYNTSFLIAQLKDFELLESGVSRHEADVNMLLNKIKELSHTQVHCLMLDLSAFWNTTSALNEYLDQYGS